MQSLSPLAVAPPPAAALAAAMSCPRCNTTVNPSAEPQACPHCRGRFTLHVGAALNPAVTLPALATKTLKQKWTYLGLPQFAKLEPGGVTQGTMDQIIGLAAIEQFAVAYGDVVSMTVWRTIGWVDGIIGILIPAPIALLSLYGAIMMLTGSGGGAAAPVLLGVGVGFGALAALLVRRGFIVGRRHVRVVGRYRPLTLRFDGNIAFYNELFRRCGLPPAPLP